MDKLSEFQSLIDASKVLNKSGAKLIALEFVDRALAMIDSENKTLTEARVYLINAARIVKLLH